MSYVHFSFQSTKDWGATTKAEDFLKILVSSGDIFVPERYGRAEPLKSAFDPVNIQSCAVFWSKNHGIMLKRKNIVWWIIDWYYKEHNLFNALSGGFDEKYFRANSSVARIIQIFKRIYLWGEMAYGCIYHWSDFEKKNVFDKLTQVYTGKLVRSSGQDLRWYLPGLYWANFFGPVYVEFFGREKFLTVPAYHKEELPDGGFLLLTAPSPLDYGHPEVQALEEAIMDHLGRDAFFEKARPEKLCRVPRFTFEQASLGRPIEVVAYDPVAEVIPDPHRFIQEAPALAEALIRRLRGKLDYSPESLKQVDDLILKKSYRRPEPWTRGEEGRQLMRELTAYYGEVLCRHLQGEWVVLESSGGTLHPTVVFTIGGVKQVEYPFARVDKLWEERVRADGLAIHYMLLQSGEWSHLEQHLKGLR